MLDVRPTQYVAPLDEQTIGPLTPVIHVENLADEDANVTGLVRIYRESLGTLLYASVMHPTALAHGESADIAVETEFDPGAPADDDYFILAEVTARSTLTGNSETVQLDQFYFDVKPAPMGPVPGTHHTTHEAGGMDEIELTGLVPLADYQLIAEKGIANGYPDLDANAMVPIIELGVGAPNGTKYLRDDQTWTTPPPDPSSHARQHAITDTDDHTSGATPGQILQADANGLPVDATNTDADVTDTVAKRNIRSNGTDTSDTPTPDSDTTDLYYLSALAAAATFGAPTGAPVDGQKLLVRIIDDGVIRALAWNSGAGGYIARGAALPTTTVAGKYLYVGFIYNATPNKWDCVATSQEA